MGDKLAEVDGDRDDQTLEESQVGEDEWMRKFKDAARKASVKGEVRERILADAYRKMKGKHFEPDRASADFIWGRRVGDDEWEVIKADANRTIQEAIEMFERTRYDWNRKTGLPPEICRMDEVSQNLFREALKAGKQKVYTIRLMVVGHLGVGKTALTKRILGEKVEEAPHVSTEGIEVHPRRVKIDLDTKEWIEEGTEHRFPNTSQHLVDLITEHVAHKSKSSTEQERLGSFATDGSVPPSFEPNIHEEKNRSNSDLHDFVTKNRTMTHSEKVFCYVTVLDFAGEFAFYSTHQAFMSWRTLYLLVTDMSKDLDDVVKDDKCSMSLNRTMERSIKDYVVFWLNSIYSHGTKAEASPQCEGSIHQETGNHEQDHHGDGKYPPVILVATHSDKVPGGENKKTQDKYFDGVRRILKDRPQRFLLKGYSALNNFGPETDIDALKHKIFELAEQQDYWGEEIPGRWLALEQKLMELKRNGEKIIEYSRVEDINNDRDVKIENPDELEVFLRFEHDLGNIVFFPTEKLRENVVLDTEWLMDGVKILISPPRHMREDPEIYPQIYAFLDTGRLAKSLIGSMWSGREQEDFHKNQDHLLDCLEKLSIIAKSVEQDVSVEKEYYWVPCVIYKSAPDHVKNPKPYEGMTKTSTLCFESTTKFIHIGVFHCLVASFLSKWPPAQEEEGGEYRIYDGCCEFKVDKCHNLLLAKNDYVIFATMFRVSSGGEYPDNELCNAVKNRIFSTLANINSCICPNSMFDICVKCEKSSTDTIKGLLRISDKTGEICTCSSPPHAVEVESLLKFWEVGHMQSEMVSEDSEGNKQETCQAHEVYESNGSKQPAQNGETLTQTDKMTEMTDHTGQIHLCESDLTKSNEFQASLRKRVLPSGKKYHVFFSYTISDIEWVRETIHTLETEYGFVCCEYDRDNTPGTSLLQFVSDSMKKACKTVIVMTRKAFQSSFVLHEIQMALTQGFSKGKTFVVPVLLEDCKIPDYLSVLHYIDARDSKRRDNWLPKLVMELAAPAAESVTKTFH